MIDDEQVSCIHEQHQAFLKETTNSYRMNIMYNEFQSSMSRMMRERMGKYPIGTNPDEVRKEKSNTDNQS